MPKQDKKSKGLAKNAYRRADYLKGRTKTAQKPGGPMSTFAKWMIVLSMGVLMIVVLTQRPNPEDREFSQNDLRRDWSEGNIELVEHIVNPGQQELKVHFKQKDNQPARVVAMDIPEDFFQLDWVKKLQEEKPEVEITTRRDNMMWQTMLYTVLPWVVVLALVYFLLFRQLRAAGGSGGVLSFGRSQPHVVTKDKQKVTFDDVAGIEEAKEEVGEIIEFLKNPTRFQRLGGRIPRGVLLVGAPGTGKTLLAKAIAGEAGVPFFAISGSDFVEMFVGVGASRVRDLFKRAKENAPCIVFLDEVDAVGRRRGAGLGGGHDEREQTLNAILVEMDGFSSEDGIILIAATNRPDVLDPALLRPGRFDREIVIDLPDLKGREQILAVHARHVKTSEEVDWKVIARGTPMFSGADLEALINEAAIMAVMRDKDSVTMKELEESRDKVRWGREKKSRTMEEADKKIIAYHEGGHALVAKLLPEVEPLHKVTIIPRGMALGSTMSLPERDVYLMSRRKLLGEITSALSGRVSEELLLGKDDVTSGSQSDFEHATKIARNMVTRWGMSEKLGTIDYSESEEHLFLGREITRTRNHSEALSLEIDLEVKRIMDICYQKAREIIESHRKELHAIADALLKYEVLDAGDVDWIMEGKDITVRKLEEAKRDEANMTKAACKVAKEEGPARRKAPEDGNSR